MVSLNFNDFYFFLSPVLLLTGLWLCFFKLNTNSTNQNNNKSISNINVLKLNSNSTFVGFYYTVLLLNFLNLYTIHGKVFIVWYNHFYLSNFTLNLLYLFTLISLSLFTLLKVTTKKTNLFKSIDYLFSINNVVLLLPYLFFSNTVFNFLFLLELVSVVLLYKLVSSKI